MKFSTAEVNKARIYKFTHKDRRVTYGLLHWPWYIVWHCAAYRSWYFAVSFGMCLTGSSCLNREQQRGKNEVRSNLFAKFCSGRKELSAPSLLSAQSVDWCWNTETLFLPRHYAINQEMGNPGLGREVLSGYICYKSAGQCLLRTVGSFSAVRFET